MKYYHCISTIYGIILTVILYDSSIQQCVDINCTLCERGFYRLNGTTCIQCNNGSTTFFIGSVSSSDCIKRPPIEELFSVNDTSCPIGTQNLYPSICTLCNLNTYGDDRHSKCKSCPASMSTILYGSKNLNQCLLKPIVEKYLNSTNNLICPDYTIRTANGLGCEICPNGTFMFKKEQKFCEICNKSSSKANNSSACKKQFDIENCPLGTQWIESLNQCYSCDYSSYRNKSSSKCDPCPNNYFSPYMGATSINNCILPPADTINGTRPFFQPQDCPLGSQWSSSIHTNSQGCRPCMANFYRDNTSIYCRPCPLNTGTFFPGSTKRRHCSVLLTPPPHRLIPITSIGCPAAFEITTEEGTTASTCCKACRVDRYKAKEGIDACLPCPANMTAPYDGSTECLRKIFVSYVEPLRSRLAIFTVTIGLVLPKSTRYFLSKISVAGQDCYVTPEILTKSIIECVVQHTTSPVSGPVKLYLNSNIVVTFGQLFTFETNPKIDNIDRKKVYSSGGLIVTISGQDLNSSSNPILKLSSTTTTRTSMNGQNISVNCTLINDMKITCILPPLQVGSLNIGMIFDNVNYYENFDILKVVQDPEFITWKDLYQIKSDRKYVTFNGTNLDSAFIKDYSIQIGSENCPVFSLTQFTLSCDAQKITKNTDFNVTITTSTKLIWNLGLLRIRQTTITTTTTTTIPTTNQPESVKSDDDDIDGNLILIIVLSCVFLLLFLIIILFIVFWTWRKHRFCAKKNLSVGGHPSSSLKWKLEAVGHSQHRFNKRHRNFDDYLIDFEQLTIQFDIDQGFFGKFCKAIYFPSNATKVFTVHTKCLYTENVKEADVNEFLSEAMTFAFVGNEFVLSPLALTYETPMKPYVVFPAFSNLNTHLKKFGSSLSLNDSIFIAIQLMEGLHCLLEKFALLHGDIATRNCVISESLKAQIADNSLARDLFRSDYIIVAECGTKSVPVRWMAPELFIENKPSVWSELWSSAILIWEIFSNADTPYHEIDIVKVPNHIMQGNRLDQPSFCPREIYELLRCSFSKNPIRRPSWKTLQNKLARFRY